MVTYKSVGTGDDVNYSPPQYAGCNILISHSLTKFGSKAWEFATPILLLQFAPGSLFAPALWGLVTMSSNLIMGPIVGSWADKVQSRMSIIFIGCSIQAATALSAVFLFAAADTTAGASYKVLIMGLLFLVGVCETLSANVASVAVKRDWVPTVFDFGDKTELSRMNTQMSRIDLIAEMAGPVLAGMVLSLSDSGIEGFIFIAGINAASFVPEYLLLRRVFSSSERLQGSRCVSKGALSTADQIFLFVPPSCCDRLARALDAWSIWAKHSGGVPIVTVSYALLYVTVLSPHGIVLTAFLADLGLEPATLSLFRGAGALGGVLGVSIFGVIHDCISLRIACLLHVVGQAFAVLVAAAAFSSALAQPSFEPGDDYTPAAPLVVFMGCIVLSRVGLYGFDVGVLELQQRQVDERSRNAIGAVESSMTSGCTLLVYASTMLVSTADQFALLTWLSAAAVILSAVTFVGYLTFWHEHEHVHSDDETAMHMHTVQEERSMVMSQHGLLHAHTHFALPSCCGTGSTAREGLDHSHDHDHTHA